MSKFIDQYINPCVAGYPVIASPRFSTLITQVDSGAEQTNQNWEHPLNRYSLPEAVRDMETFQSVRDHWLVMRGPAHTFPFRDPLDFASRNLLRPNEVPDITDEDQVLAVGDGVTRIFQLKKKYSVGSFEYTRNIYLPVVESVMIKIDYSIPEPPTWTISRYGGIVEFSFPPRDGSLVTCGYLFDTEVRFESDSSFDGIVNAFSLGGFADIQLVETRFCG